MDRVAGDGKLAIVLDVEEVITDLQAFWRE
jgi:hypothetical protein